MACRVSWSAFTSFMLCLPLLHAEIETWEQDMSDDMKIGVSLTGYQGVDLVCGLEAFHVNVSVDNTFQGVIYTRGSFSFDAVESECFTATSQPQRPDLFSLVIPFDKCKTVEDKDMSRYINTIVVQHDKDLIMPGDAAFSLDCSMHHALTVSAISVVDPDPSVQASSKNFTERTSTSTVSLRPGKFRDEL